MTDELAPLVAAARAGDAAAFARLVERTAASVRAAARREVDDPALAEDAVQEAYVRAFRRLDSLRDPAAFAGWIRRIAVTVARDAARRRRPVFVDPARLDRSAAGAAADPDGTGAGAALDRAIARLGPADRRLLERYYRGGWTTGRLAAAEGVSEAAIRKRLQRTRDTMRREMAMDDERDDLPARIAELLARPRLVDRPENPVGAVWAAIRASRPTDEVVELPERIRRADAAAIVGADAAGATADGVFRADDETILRYDQTVPMLLAARGRPVGARLLAAGKVYRDAPEDAGHMPAFHQAEALWIGKGLTVWSLVAWLEPLLGTLVPGARLRLEAADYPRYATTGYELAIAGEGEGEWTEIGGLARFSDATVAALGHDPAATAAVGAGLGLERIACLAYGVDDVRRLSAEDAPDASN